MSRNEWVVHTGNVSPVSYFELVDVMGSDGFIYERMMPRNVIWAAGLNYRLSEPYDYELADFRKILLKDINYYQELNKNPRGRPYHKNDLKLVINIWLDRLGGLAGVW